MQRFTLFLLLISVCLLPSCGMENLKGPDSDVKISSSMWSRVDFKKTVIGVDKYFSGSSPASFFQCLKKARVEYYLATYNAEITGGRAVDVHLRNAKAAGMGLSAYFAFNSEHGMRDEDIADFLRRIKPFKLNTVWLDIEAKARNVDPNTIKWYKIVCQKAGYKCGVYTNRAAMSKAGYPTDFKAPLAKMYLWIAMWNSDPNPIVPLTNFYGWKKSAGHQFVNGQFCGTEVDVNAFARVVFEPKKKKKAKEDPPKAKPKPKPEPETESKPKPKPKPKPDPDEGRSRGPEEVKPKPLPKPVTEEAATATTSTKAPKKIDGMYKCQVGNLSGGRAIRVRAEPDSSSEQVQIIPNQIWLWILDFVPGEEIRDDALGRSAERWGQLKVGGYINELYLNCS